MYEEILGRPASAPEKKVLDLGFNPRFKVNDRVELVQSPNVVSTIDAVVLFAVPPHPIHPRPSLAWGYRLVGYRDYVPMDSIKEFTP